MSKKLLLTLLISVIFGIAIAAASYGIQRDSHQQVLWAIQTECGYTVHNRGLPISYYQTNDDTPFPVTDYPASTTFYRVKLIYDAVIWAAAACLIITISQLKRSKK